SPFAMGRTAAPAAGRMTGAATVAPRPIRRPPPHPLVAVSSRFMLLSSLSLPSRKFHIGLPAPIERGRAHDRSGRNAIAKRRRATPWLSRLQGQIGFPAVRGGIE